MFNAEMIRLIDRCCGAQNRSARKRCFVYHTHSITMELRVVLRYYEVLSILRFASGNRKML